MANQNQRKFRKVTLCDGTTFTVEIDVERSKRDRKIIQKSAKKVREYLRGGK